MSLQSSQPKLRVAICGAGIGGLTLAITIAKYNPSISTDIYEAHTSIETPGVGISVWRKTHKVLIDLGLFDDFKEIFTQTPENTRGAVFRRSDIREGGYPWFQLAPQHGRSGMHRQHMVAVLAKHLPTSCNILFKKRLVNYVESEQDAHSPIRLEFADGTTATADVLIGADGIRSAVRKAMFEAASKDDADDNANYQQYIGAMFSGITIYRGVVPAELLRKETPDNDALQGLTGHTGIGRFFAAYPIARGSLINFAAYLCDPSLTGTRYEGHWVSDATRDELARCFEDFEPNVRAIVKLCEKPSKWGLHITKPLPFYVRNRIALVGDACHAMPPQYGAGAVEAIDDAWVLGRLIAHPLASLSCIQDVLRIYDELRLPIANTIASQSLSAGWLYAFMAPDHYDGMRKQVDLDNHGISSYEKEGMDSNKQEIIKRWDTLDEVKNAPQVWEYAELKLRALAVTCSTRKDDSLKLSKL